MKNLGIALALGDIYSRAGIGPLNQPLDGGIARFNAVVAELTCNANSLVVCSAGYSKEFPSVSNQDRRESLAGQLKQYVHDYAPAWNWNLVAEPICWGTRNEVRVGIKLAQRFCFARKDEEVFVVIASNLTHLIRIWLYAKLYTPKNWKFKLVRAQHHFSLLSHLLEPLKILRDVLYILRVLHRLRRLKK